MKILSIVGTRPEAVKMAPILRELDRQSWCQSELLLTGQHRDLVDSALKQFGVRPDYDLNLMMPGQSLGSLTGRAFVALEEKIKEIGPDLILSQGDTTTVMVSSIVAFYLRIPFGHVEAGLRTGDVRNPFPEEINRVITGRVADLHFAPTPASAQALYREFVPEKKVFVTGNSVIDNLAFYSEKVSLSPHRAPEGGKLVLLTSHRRENFGAPMREYFTGLREVVDARPDVHLVYPVHPNPEVIEAASEKLGDHERIKLIDPMAYFDFVATMKAADVIVTDSGGVQEEAPFFHKPVLVLREETERPEAVSAGVAHLVGLSRERVRDKVLRLLSDPDYYSSMASGASPYGDGHASERIVQAIADFTGKPYEGERREAFKG
ncbi:non-hydrolyzing UDP-N-acetylglucosamine 2-epimerase [Henriciella sp.]|uniref:non-hydrolyzing UDP-N-acetylglucosamine 2-epimerase n=1 Tax=Henriciella sp. TaxID=1968823 RepID=UPI002638FE1B|nr:UDP-N-acetylglucosamine 2-epimerase (non-hydrolyzing) [Henriciella sp.]